MSRVHKLFKITIVVFFSSFLGSIKRKERLSHGQQSWKTFVGADHRKTGQKIHTHTHTDAAFKSGAD